MIPIPSPLVEFILLGPLDDRRQLQDSPILGDVWVEFGKKPDQALDLLIPPYHGQHAGEIASQIETKLRLFRKTKTERRDARIAYLQGLGVAELNFRELVEIVVPLTGWWAKRWTEKKPEAPKVSAKKGSKQKSAAPDPQPLFEHDLSDYKADRVIKASTEILEFAKEWHFDKDSSKVRELRSLDRFVVLAGLILWAAQHRDRSAPLAKKSSLTSKKRSARSVGTSSLTTEEQITYILNNVTPKEIARTLEGLNDKLFATYPREVSKRPKPLVWQVSLNRVAMPALTKSIPAVKADAARTLFNVNCSEIAWAVIDSGIDGSHPAFSTPDGPRVKKSYDFKNYRQIVSLSNADPGLRRSTLKALRDDDTWQNLLNPPTPKDAAANLSRLAENARSGGPIHWELVEQFVEIKPATKPATAHGTHVAGIIGASKEAAQQQSKSDSSEFADGMCPDIQLYDFRVLGTDIRNTEFAIIAALQFIRHLNERHNFITIHGANLSLSIPHDVRNFACGRTPICDECEKLIDSGVVVVAAAGNHGYKSFETKEGSYDSYAAFSITDPGNADGVITVGATHRFWPHTYGVSFFSSRGPTGDGRLKPDLVAPGERIHAPVSGDSNVAGGEWGDLDGTSMAAPHVSGAAAMLLARYSELVGRPRRVKQILCESATDLGRERSFQGHGMLDVLRSFQAI
jgi:serine protease AprX